jgi:hypothetical protein
LRVSLPCAVRALVADTMPLSMPVPPVRVQIFGREIDDTVTAPVVEIVPLTADAP